MKTFWVCTIVAVFIIFIVPRDWETRVPGYDLSVILLGIIWAWVHDVVRRRQK